MASFQQPRIARKFGPSFGRADFVPSASVGYRELGKVKVDCRFCLSKSKWGIIGDPASPGGILYMDLSFDQPKECRLSSATVTVTLDHVDEDDAPGMPQPEPSSLQITDYFGPRHLSGDEKIISVKSTYHMTPNINVLGNGAGGVGKDIEKNRTYTSKWTFTGSLQPGKDKSTGRRGARILTYKTIKWELSENDLDPGATHSNIFHTAFAFEHEEKACYIRVEIDGKLQRTRDRLRQSLRFPPRKKEDQGTTIVRLDLDRSIARSKKCLDPIAKGLARAMEMANYEEIPVKLPDSLQPSFQQVAGDYTGSSQMEHSTPHQSTTITTTSATTTNASPKPQNYAPSSKINTLPHFMLAAPNPIHEDPTIQCLSQAHDFFPITPPNRHHDRDCEHEVVETYSPGSSFSGATLVENKPFPVTIEVQTREPREINLEMIQKDLAVDPEILLRLSQSPLLLLFIQLFARLIDLFSMRQKSPIYQKNCLDDADDSGEMKMSISRNQNINSLGKINQHAYT